MELETKSGFSRSPGNQIGQLWTESWVDLTIHVRIACNKGLLFNSPPSVIYGLRVIRLNLFWPLFRIGFVTSPSWFFISIWCWLEMEIRPVHLWPCWHFDARGMFSNLDLFWHLEIPSCMGVHSCEIVYNCTEQCGADTCACAGVSDWTQSWPDVVFFWNVCPYVPCQVAAWLKLLLKTACHSSHVERLFFIISCTANILWWPEVFRPQNILVNGSSEK